MSVSGVIGLPQSWASAALACSALLTSIMIAGCDSTDVASQPSEDQAVDVLSDSPAADQATASLTLNIGDPAPDLQVAKWVAGTPVDDTLSDGVYVVEFWATWCGPCLRGMPHISKLQQHYGDEVKFVGVTREDVETVTEFLQRESPEGSLWSDVVKYRLAIDSDDATNTAYMAAANQNGIPTAFIVGREGMIEWIGHPMNIDDPLQQVVDGSWDRDAALAELRQRQRMSELSDQLRQWEQNQEWDEALGAIDQLEQESGRTAGLLQFRMMILERSGKVEEAESLRTEIVDLAWDNASTLNAIAWNIASSGKSNGLELAKRAGERASELRDHKDPAILDTVARVHYELGDLEEAIRWQRLAVDNNSGMEEINETLKKYLAEQDASAEPGASQSGNGDSDDGDTGDDESAESDGEESDAA